MSLPNYRVYDREGLNRTEILFLAGTASKHLLVVSDTRRDRGACSLGVQMAEQQRAIERDKGHETNTEISRGH